LNAKAEKIKKEWDNYKMKQKEAAAAIPMYSLLTSEEDDSSNEHSDTKSNANEEGGRPVTAWNLFNFAVRGKGLTREQIVRICISSLTASFYFCLPLLTCYTKYSR
jgi:hypothetical protein